MEKEFITQYLTLEVDETHQIILQVLNVSGFAFAMIVNSLSQAVMPYSLSQIT